MLTLYVAKNTIAVAAHIALQETGLPYQVKWISFAESGQRSPDFLSINPKGRVPALISGDDVITETPAILEFIAETAGLFIPSSISARARVRELMSYCASTFHVNHAHKMRGSRWSDDEAAHASMAAKVPQTMADSCAYLEGLLGKTWYAGEYCIADMHLYAICRWLAGDGVDIAAYPNLSRHHQTVGARAAVQVVEALHG